MPKRKWTTPVLIVVLRGKPEERVLAACKNDPVRVIGAGGDYGYCVSGIFPRPCASDCLTQAAS